MDLRTGLQEARSLGVHSHYAGSGIKIRSEVVQRRRDLSWRVGTIDQPSGCPAGAPLADSLIGKMMAVGR